MTLFKQISTFSRMFAGTKGGKRLLFQVNSTKFIKKLILYRKLIPWKIRFDTAEFCHRRQCWQLVVALKNVELHVFFISVRFFFTFSEKVHIFIPVNFIWFSSQRNYFIPFESLGCVTPWRVATLSFMDMIKRADYYPFCIIFSFSMGKVYFQWVDFFPMCRITIKLNYIPWEMDTSKDKWWKSTALKTITSQWIHSLDEFGFLYEFDSLSSLMYILSSCIRVDLYKNRFFA